MSRLSIKTKIILATTIVMALVFASFSIVVYQKAKSAYRERLDARLEGYAEKLREEVEEQYLEKRFPAEADLRAIRVEGLMDPLMCLSDSNGTIVLSDSLLAPSAKKPWSEIVSREFTFEDVILAGNRYRALWAPVEAADQDRFSVHIAASLDEVEASLALLRLLMLMGVPVALLISAFAVFAIATTAMRPLSRMVRTAEKITESNLGERIPESRNRDEVFALAATLNTMMDRIEQAFTSQKQFVADASHEIRTPLAIIRSELEYAQKQPEKSGTMESLATALDEVERLKKLSDDLLLLARLDSASLTMKTQAFRLDELLADCVRKMKTIADARKISLSLTIHDVVELTGDEDKIGRAILNLLDNAIKYSAEGGTVEISTRGSNESVEVEVRDHGVGLNSDDMKSIFERFHRSNSSRSQHDGNGLGLAIVRKILEVHGGNVSVWNTPGNGCTFTFVLPRESRRQSSST